MKKLKADKVLKNIKRDLAKVLSYADIGENDPFDYDFFESVDSKTKKSIEAIWRNIYLYYSLVEKWHRHGYFSNYADLPPYILSHARKVGVHGITEKFMEEVGGYLNSSWLVYVPFTKTKGAFREKEASWINRKIGKNIWVATIGDEEKHYQWAFRNFGGSLRANEKRKWKTRISTFHHQLCQIGGGKYEPKERVSGHYLVYRFNGPLRSLDSEHDPSVLFFLFCRGLKSLESDGESDSDTMFSRYHQMEPDGIIGIGLKDFEPWRFRRNVLVELNINVGSDLFNVLRTSKFSKICEKLYSSGELDERWDAVKQAADLLYQYIENESLKGNAYTKNTLSTVVLCSAAEALLKLDGKPIKKSLSSLLASMLFPKGDADFDESVSLLEEAYKVRSEFVHGGKIGNVDNKRLFFLIFKAWLEIAQFYLKTEASKAPLSQLIIRKLTSKSQIYQKIFERDYIR